MRRIQLHALVLALLGMLAPGFALSEESADGRVQIPLEAYQQLLEAAGCDGEGTARVVMVRRTRRRERKREKRVRRAREAPVVLEALA